MPRSIYASKYPKAYKTYKKKYTAKKQTPVTRAMIATSPAGAVAGPGNRTVHRICRLVDSGNIAAQTAANTNSTIEFTLSALGSTDADLKAFFNQWRIREVETWIKPLFNAISGTTNPGTGYLLFAVNPVASGGATFAGLFNFENAVVVEAHESHYVKWKPKVAPLTATSGGNSPAGLSDDMWLATTDDTVVYSGLNFSTNVTGTANNPIWHVIHKVYAEFRAVI